MEMMFCRALIRFSNESSFSLRDAYRDVGGRAKHGAIAEKGRMRG
jgi:hypothetical protein